MCYAAAGAAKPGMCQQILQKHHMPGLATPAAAKHNHTSTKQHMHHDTQGSHPAKHTVRSWNKVAARPNHEFSKTSEAWERGVAHRWGRWGCVELYSVRNTPLPCLTAFPKIMTGACCHLVPRLTRLCFEDTVNLANARCEPGPTVQ